MKFADVLQNLNGIYGSKIKEQKAFQKATDSLFFDSKYVMIVQMVLLTMGLYVITHLKEIHFMELAFLGKQI